MLNANAQKANQLNAHGTSKGGVGKAKVSKEATLGPPRSPAMATGSAPPPSAATIATATPGAQPSAQSRAESHPPDEKGVAAESRAAESFTAERVQADGHVHAGMQPPCQVEEPAAQLVGLNGATQAPSTSESSDGVSNGVWLEPVGDSLAEAASDGGTVGTPPAVGALDATSGAAVGCSDRLPSVSPSKAHLERAAEGTAKGTAEGTAEGTQASPPPLKREPTRRGTSLLPTKPKSPTDGKVAQSKSLPQGKPLSPSAKALSEADLAAGDETGLQGEGISLNNASKRHSGYGQARKVKKKVEKVVVEERTSPFASSPLMTAVLPLQAREGFEHSSPLVGPNARIVPGSLMRVGEVHELVERARGKQTIEQRMLVELDGDTAPLGWVTGVAKDETENLKLAAVTFPLMTAVRTLPVREGPGPETQKCGELPENTNIRVMESIVLADGTTRVRSAAHKHTYAHPRPHDDEAVDKEEGARRREGG